MALVRQASFAAGELDPHLRGRTDLPAYAMGLRSLFNCFVSKHGSAVSRAGAQYLGLAADAFKQLRDLSGGWTHPTETGLYVNAGANVKLSPFYFSSTDTSQNYVLEWGEQSLQIWKNGAPLSFSLWDAAGDAGGAPYAAADLYKLRWVQSGDTVTLTCAGYPPFNLVRGVKGDTVTGSESDWTLAPLDFSRDVPADIAPNPRVLEFYNSFVSSVDSAHQAEPWSWLVTEVTQDERGVRTESAPVKATGFLWYGSEWNNWTTYKAGTIVAYDTIANGVSMQRYWVSIANGNIGNTPPNDDTSNAYWTCVPQYASDTTYAAGDLVAQENDGPSVWTPATNVFVSQQDSNTGHALTDASWWKTATTSYQEDDWSAVDYQLPLYADRPLTLWLPTAAGDNAFSGASAATGSTFVTFNVYRGKGGVYGQVGTSAGPFFVDQGDEPDYTTTPPQGINPFETTPGDLDTLEHPVSVAYYQDRLTFGGTESRWATLLASATSDYANFDQHLVPVDSDSVIFALAARRYDLIRSIVGLDKMFVLTDGGVWVVGGAEGTPFSPESIDAHVYSDIGADWPNPLVVAGAVVYVRDKGTGVRGIKFDWQRGGFAGLDLSFSAEHLMLGHKIVDLCFAEDPWSVAWLVRDDGELLSLTYSPEGELWGWAEHVVAAASVATAICPSGKVLSVCSIPEADEDVVYLALQGPALAVGAWSSLLTYDDGAGVEYNGHYFVSLSGGNLDNTPNSDGSTSAYWGTYESTTQSCWILRFSTRLEVPGIKMPVCVDAYTEFTYDSEDSGDFVTFGMDYLDDQDVMAQYSTGDTFGPLTVSGGSVSVPAPSSKPAMLWVGLPYVPKLETLDLADGKTLRKVITEVGLEVIGNTSLNVGETLTGELVPSKVSAGDGQLLRVPVISAWNTGGRAALTQTTPLPVTVLGLTRKVEASDD